MKASIYTGIKTILLVDHEDYLSDFLRKLLLKKGYQVMAAETPEEALSVYKTSRSRVDMVLMDVTKNTVNGIKACNELKESDPSLPILLTSIYSHEYLGEMQRLPFLRKPMAPSDLFGILDIMLNEPQLLTRTGA